MPAKAKIEVPYEHVHVKLPEGLHQELAEVLLRERRWPSRQDFIIDAVREKLDRLRSPERPPRTVAGRRSA